MADHEKLYVDGGILNNLPIEPVKDKCDFLIGVHMNSIAKGFEAPPGMRKTLDRIFHLALSNAVYAKSEHCHLVHRSTCHDAVWNAGEKNAHKIFEYAYAYAMKQLETVSIRSF